VAAIERRDDKREQQQKRSNKKKSKLSGGPMGKQALAHGRKGENDTRTVAL